MLKPKQVNWLRVTLERSSLVLSLIEPHMLSY